MAIMSANMSYTITDETRFVTPVWLLFVLLSITIFTDDHI